ncbi:MAG: peroxidase-related enzyme [Gammaproteobacteria bacterium]|nr:peroxidase-related enzyme [Gammaproteobacteria bacterium]
MNPTQRIHELDLPVPEDAALPEDIQAYFAKCSEKLGMVPNVLRSYSFDEQKLRCFMEFYNELMLGESGLDKLEREMIAVVVSAANRCHYCLTAHGQAVRHLSGDPSLGEALVMNFRAAVLTTRQRRMLEFAWQLTVSPEAVGEAEREALRAAGLSERELWDVAAVTAFFNMSNRMASAIGMQPNPEYHAMSR